MKFATPPFVGGIGHDPNQSGRPDRVDRMHQNPLKPMVPLHRFTARAYPNVMPFKSEKIREFRLRVGLTQSALGKVLQVPQSTVARWKTGFSVPTAEHIGLMCDFGYVQGIRPDFFFPNFSELNSRPAKEERKRHDSENR